MLTPRGLISSALVLFFAVFGAAVAPRASEPDPTGELVILPERTVLRGQGARQQLLIERRADGSFIGAHADEATFSSSNPNVATVDESGVVTAVADGRAILTAKVDGRSISTVIEVERASARYPVSFRNHVVPVLTKAGCNSGPCHGAAAGKNGFKLTLRGYDPELDYLTLTRQASARRINKVDPAASLMLLKPTVAVSHGGGKRFSPRSPEYRVIADWIASGTPAPAEWDPVMTRLEVFPASARLAVGTEQPLLVRAHFSDGHAEDVTRWVKFSTNEGAVAGVDQRGAVTVMALAKPPSRRGI